MTPQPYPTTLPPDGKLQQKQVLGQLLPNVQIFTRKQVQRYKRLVCPGSGETQDPRDPRAQPLAVGSLPSWSKDAEFPRIFLAIIYLHHLTLLL